MGDYSEMENALTEANFLNNLDPVVWAYLVLLCQHTHRPVQAEQSLKYAIKVRERNALIMYQIHVISAIYFI